MAELQQTIQDRFTSKTKEIEDLKADAQDKDKEIARIESSYQESLSSLEKQIAEQAEVLGQKDSIIKELKASIKDLTDEKSRIETELDSKSRALEIAESKLAESETANAELRDEITRLKDSQKVELEKRDAEVKSETR